MVLIYCLIIISIVKVFIREASVKFGIFDQLGADERKEHYLILGIRELFIDSPSCTIQTNRI